MEVAARVALPTNSSKQSLLSYGSHRKFLSSFDSKCSVVEQRQHRYLLAHIKCLSADQYLRVAFPMRRFGQEWDRES